MVNPLVSVIIPAYQSESTLERCLESVLAQDYENMEVIVVNNGSSDRTQKIIEAFAARDTRIKPIYLDINQKPAGGRNAGIDKAEGEFVAFLDADDEWLPGKISSQIAMFNLHQDMDLLFTDVHNYDQASGKTTLYSTTNKIFRRGLQLVVADENRPLYHVKGPVKKELYLGDFISVSSAMLRRSCLQGTNGFDITCFGTEDIDFWVRLADKHHYYYLAEVTTRRYLMSDSTSRITDLHLEELLRYHKAALTSPAYNDMLDIAKRNLFLTYKSMILRYADHWQIGKAWKTYKDSVQYHLNTNLWIYALLSIFGPIPLKVKTEIINPLLAKIH